VKLKWTKLLVEASKSLHLYKELMHYNHSEILFSKEVKQILDNEVK